MNTSFYFCVLAFNFRHRFELLPQSAESEEYSSLVVLRRGSSLVIFATLKCNGDLAIYGTDFSLGRPDECVLLDCLTLQLPMHSVPRLHLSRQYQNRAALHIDPPWTISTDASGPYAFVSTHEVSI